MRRPVGRAFLVPLLVSVGLLTSCSETGPGAPTAPDPSALTSQGFAGGQELGPAIAAANRHTPDFLTRPGVVGTAVGLDVSGQPVVKVFLAGPGVPELPDQVDGIPVAVEITGLFVPRTDRTARARPAPIGFSVGHPDITAGTLGARVTGGGSVFILSNNHVLANRNKARVGDPTLQPGAFDGGTAPGDVIGTLADFEPIRFDGSLNYMDAAISLVPADAVSGSTPPDEGYGAPGISPVAPGLNAGVQKYGRTTGHTTGTVDLVNVTVSICYQPQGPFRCKQAAIFTDQISIVPGAFSAGGDSGSLIVTDDGAKSPTALLFAGNSSHTIATPIAAVLDRFGVTIDPTVPEVEPPPDPDPDPEPEPAISLAANGYKVRGMQKVDLTWSGAGTAQVDITREGSALVTVANTGAYTDNIDQRGGGSYTYRVCEAGSATCSDEVTVIF